MCNHRVRFKKSHTSAKLPLFLRNKQHFPIFFQLSRKKMPFALCRKENYLYFCIAKQHGAIAQLVEQRTENPCVPGSIPGGTTLRKSKSLQTPDFQTKSGVFLFPRNAKNGNIFPFPVEQKVEQKGGRKISTSKASFALICNILRIKKARKISYFCKNK